MEVNINFENKPKNFIVCFNENCSLMENCLRRLAAIHDSENSDLLTVVNASKFNESNCKYFLENKKTRIAYGMKDSFEDVKAKDIANIRKELKNHFGLTYYYERRNGKMPITPKDQEFISNLFNSYGYEIKFDEIKEETLWK
jgi:hypothetical protein